MKKAVSTAYYHMAWYQGSEKTCEEKQRPSSRQRTSTLTAHQNPGSF